MAAIDDPEKYSFVRGGVQTNTNPGAGTRAKWTQVLMGKALTNFMWVSGIATGNRAAAAYRAKQRQGKLQPGFSRGGKPIPMKDPNAGANDQG